MSNAVLTAIADERRMAVLAATLDTCPYAQVRDRMLDIENHYGGRTMVPRDLATEIGIRLRRRPDYFKLVAWNGLDPATCRSQGYGPRHVPSRFDPQRVTMEIAAFVERLKSKMGGK